MSPLNRYLLAALLMLSSLQLRADEGMWLLSLLKGYTIEDMQKNGFKLTAEDIYSVNQACLKDAVVIFGGGCTGELISGEGLVLTNHHCGYSSIQSHSSVENDYLTNGFWAMSKEEELPNEGLSVRFLRYMKEVTVEVNDGISEEMSKDEIDSKVQSNITAIVNEASEDDKYEANVNSMFYGNQYFLFVYERYSDVRLVGAPPSAIGNFGQDTDNWIWPRHTGDFSIFRVYADENNEPASYSPDNVPYKPKRFLEIATDGIAKGDFTMILGYPGSTQQFLYSDAIEQMVNKTLPLNIDIRTTRMEIMDKYMNASDEVRIQYAAKYRGVTNAWKKWQGAIRGLERLNAVEKKQAFEKEFAAWVSSSDELTDNYGTLLDSFKEIYEAYNGYQTINSLMREAVFTIESFRIAATLNRMIQQSQDVDVITKRAEGLYKDYFAPLDKEMFSAMMKYYFDNADPEFFPTFFDEVNKKHKGSMESYAEKAYTKSAFTSREKTLELIDIYAKKPSKALKKISKDPIVSIYEQFVNLYGQKVMSQFSLLGKNLDQLYKTWVEARMLMMPDKHFYPDANFTMRLTYGKIEGYSPEDAVIYDYHTRLKGVMEKEKIGMHDYIVPDHLVDLYENKEFGNYGVNGTMPVCFTASNHTSGGNSGSPVLDANGRLIGINFDRNWHGTMSDEMYDPSVCRNISVDIRYILFIIDKYAEASYLLDEMVLVND